MRDAFARPQHVAVVGGSSDIGLAIADRLAPERLSILGRDPRRLSSIRPGAKIVEWDATDDESHERAASELFSNGDVDVIIIAAGILHPEPDVSQCQEMLTVNGSGAASIMLQVAQQLKQQGHGTLVVLSSVAAVRPRPSNYVYGAAKAMLDHAARGLEPTMSDAGLEVLIVRPGYVRTSMTQGIPEAPFAVDAGTVANIVAAAVRDRRRGVLWVPPQIRVIGRLLQMLPQSIVNALDRRSQT